MSPKLIATANDTFTTIFENGVIALNQEDLDKAFTLFNQAYTLLAQTNSPHAPFMQRVFELGNRFFSQHQPDQALACFSLLCSLNPNLGAVHHNIGFTLAEQCGDHEKALQAYNKALLIQPTSAIVHFCRAQSLLATGNLAEGFQEYRWRWQRGAQSPRSFTYPLPRQWYGQDLAGKTVLLRVEQGLGDTLQFIRYAQLLYTQGATVLAEVQKPLVTLLQECPYLHTVISIGSPFPFYDYEMPLLDLPALFATTLDTIPNAIPYLGANNELIEQWRHYFCHTTFNIGICWQGDASHNPSKFMPLSFFADLATIDGVRLFSLQKFSDATQTQPYHESITFFDDSFDTTHGRFMDTAAVMRNLDLVLTVDTSIAHLAGSLGVPVWVVLPFPAEWRWLENRTDSPWYPTMRLFRQTAYNRWDTIAREIKKALLLILNNR